MPVYPGARRVTLDPYRKCPDARVRIEARDLEAGALWIRAFEVSRWRGGYGNREAMGFESSSVRRLSVIRDPVVDRAEEETSGARQMVANGPFALILEKRFAALGHTAIRRAEAHGAEAPRNTLLRAVKDANPARLFTQDLLDGQSLHHTHSAAAAWTLPNSGFTVDRRRGFRRYRGEQSPA